jgi:hypothetical protein
MKLVADARNWHRFRSIQFGAVGVACGAALTAYGAALAISPTLVSGIPHWTLTVLTAGTMLAPIASMIARVIDQPNLPPCESRPPKP